MISYISRIIADPDPALHAAIERHGCLWEVKLKGEGAAHLTPEEMERTLRDAIAARRG